MTSNALDINPHNVETRDIVALEQFEKDVLYIEANRQNWLDELSDCWVVVYREKLIAHADTPHEALAKVQDQGLQANDVALEHISGDPLITIL